MKVIGNAVVAENSDNLDGSKAVDTWRFSDVDQVEKHAGQFETAGVKVRTETKADGQHVYATQKLSKGDASALRDAANEAAKQRDS